MLTPDQVAKRLGVSRATVYRLCSSGQLAAVRIGGAATKFRRGDEFRGTIRIEPASVEKLLAESRIAPPPAMPAKPIVRPARPTLARFAPRAGGAA